MHNGNQNPKERLNEYTSSAMNEAQDKAKQTMAELQGQIHQTQEQLTKLTNEVDKQLKENPWPIVIGVGVGCLLLGTVLGALKTK